MKENVLARCLDYGCRAQKDASIIFLHVLFGCFFFSLTLRKSALFVFWKSEVSHSQPRRTLCIKIGLSVRTQVFLIIYNTGTVYKAYIQHE